ncbi:DUF1080 domain-containing protein [Candidatus Daviesbacteria bacterium]|nr:DUF1080 domain-containing protein [Candidatus Daviesbacteria bacterium]
MLPLRPLLWLVIVLVVFVALIPNSFAAPGDILLTDNFNDGNLDGWTIESGNWYINSGNLAGSKSGILFGGKINTGSSEWDNYRIELDVNGFQGIDQGIEFRYSQNSSYKIHLRYDPGRKQYGTPEIRLEKNNGTDNILLTNTLSFPLISNKWYHLKIEALNENIKFWIDNTPVFDFTDTNTNVKKGTLALSYWSGEVGIAYMKFDNIKVTALAPPPPPRLPVIFIPGIGGSEFQANGIIPWKDRDDGHGGQYSYVYAAGEKIWVNSDEAVKLGNDDYFDVLRLKEDGQTSEADIALTGNLTSFGYQDLDSFFTDMGYIKDINYFVFPYDWRKDVRNTKDSLDALIEEAKQKSGQPQVNLVVHSMGGLVGRYYISDSTKAIKINKLIELGVPHLGAPSAIKALVYGEPVGRWYFKIINIGINGNEVKDVIHNFPSHYSLIPSVKYYDFYNNSKDLPYPYKDDRDIDNNKVTGGLNYDRTKNLLFNLGLNINAFNLGEQFHNNLDSLLNQTNGTKIYEIVGTSQPTLGQIHETWWITWPINLIPKTDEIYINGDDTVPLYSASLKNDSQDLSGAAKIYYTEQKHSDLVASAGTAMQTVKAILNEDNALPVEVKDIKIDLEGEQISFDDGELDLYDEQDRHCGLNSNGEIEENIPEVTPDFCKLVRESKIFE